MPRTEDQKACLGHNQLSGTMPIETEDQHQPLFWQSMKKMGKKPTEPEHMLLEGHLLATLQQGAQTTTPSFPPPSSFGTKGKGKGHLFFPFSITRNPTNGDFLLSDKGGERVQLFDQQGTFLSQLTHSFSLPSLAFDPYHNHIIISDFFSGEISVFSSSSPCSSPLFTFGGHGFLPHQLQGPLGVAANPKHPLLYVVNSLSHRISIFSSSTGKFLKSFGKKGKAKGEFNNPTSVAVSPKSGRVFVCDYSNHRVQIFSPSGGYLGEIKGGVELPKAVEVDEKGRVYVTTSSGNELKVFAENGEFLEKMGGFQDPVDIVASGEEVYVVDSGNHRVVQCNVFI
mmetsp:Transcript_9770/g.14784  ORF Transcript_9770/g.14784 Transcript_9770/m.14784 type:complete len:340 (-) Transcript_9770:19-1038(-)